MTPRTNHHPAARSMPRAVALTHLQGWRGSDLETAVAAGARSQRIGPAGCALLALTAAATTSLPLTLLTLATAVAGTFADHHPIEAVHNAWSARRGGTALPPNRAAKRFGCAAASVVLAGAAGALAAGHVGIAAALLVALGTLSTFVAASGVCVPSLLFNALFGVERGTRRDLLPGLGGA